MDTSEGVTWPSVITDVAQLPVAYTQENPEGIKWPWVTSGSPVTTTKKKTRGKSRTCAEPTSGQGRLLTGPLPVTWRCHFRSKGPTRADIAQNILPDRVTFGHVTDVTSGHLTAPPQMRLCPYPYTTCWFSAKRAYSSSSSSKYRIDSKGRMELSRRGD